MVSDRQFALGQSRRLTECDVLLLGRYGDGAAYLAQGRCETSNAQTADGRLLAVIIRRESRFNRLVYYNRSTARFRRRHLVGRDRICRTGIFLLSLLPLLDPANARNRRYSRSRPLRWRRT